MKVQGKVSRTQTIEGTISHTELLALVRETMNIPEGATATFYVSGYRPNTLNMQQFGGMVPSTARIDESAPLQFRITWSLPVGKDEQG